MEGVHAVNLNLCVRVCVCARVCVCVCALMRLRWCRALSLQPACVVAARPYFNISSIMTHVVMCDNIMTHV